MRDLDTRMTGQQTIARDAVEAKAAIAGMQVGVRDIRLAGSSADLQKANDNVAARVKSASHFGDEMLKLSKSPENRARIEKLKARAEEYFKGAQQIAAVRGEAIAAGGGADAAAKVAKLNDEVMPHCPRSHAADRCRTRTARQPDRRVRQAQRGRTGGAGRQGNGTRRSGNRLPWASARFVLLIVTSIFLLLHHSRVRCVR
jgi:hypothetical protein